MKNLDKTTDRENYFLNLQLEKTKEILDIKETTERLLDLNHGLLLRLVSIYRKNNISLDPETKAMIADVRKTLHSMYSPSGHPTTQKKTGHLDYTEPSILNH